jgi:hypothetical protein
MYRLPFSARAAVLVGAIAVSSVACDKEVIQKSSNPTSPLIAGAIAGVGISAPGLSSPASGARVPVEQQPITLVIQNATTNGVRTVYYAFDISADPSFATVLVAQDGVTAGSSSTSFKLPAALAPEKTYYWRAQARDGANASDYSGTGSFTVYTPVVVQTPVLVSPVNSERVTSRSPDLTWTNSTRTGPASAITYAIQVATDEAFTGVVAYWTQPEGTTRTTSAVPATLNYDARYYWRVRAVEATVTSPWSSTQTFLAPATPVVVTPPPTGGGGSAPSPNDEIDLRNVTIVLGPANFASWTVNSTITGITQGGGDFCIYHTKLGQWPSTAFFGDPATQLEGNQWVFANIGGRWYGGAADWYRPGQACKSGIYADTIGRDAFYNPSQEPLHSWVPAVGELYGIASSTPARAWPNMSTLDARTNTVTRRWQ